MPQSQRRLIGPPPHRTLSALGHPLRLAAARLRSCSSHPAELRVVPLLYHVEPDQLPATLRDVKAYRLTENELDAYLRELAARATNDADDADADRN